MTEGSSGLRAGKSSAFLDLRGLLRAGRSRRKVPGLRIFGRNAAKASSCRSGGKPRRCLSRRLGMREADPGRGNGRGGRADPDDPASAW